MALQGNDHELVRPQNDPPNSSYFADYDGQYEDPNNQGHIGDVSRSGSNAAAAISRPICRRPATCHRRASTSPSPTRDAPDLPLRRRRMVLRLHHPGQEYRLDALLGPGQRRRLAAGQQSGRQAEFCAAAKLELRPDRLDRISMRLSAGRPVPRRQPRPLRDRQAADARQRALLARQRRQHRLALWRWRRQAGRRLRLRLGPDSGQQMPAAGRAQDQPQAAEVRPSRRLP